MTLPRENDTEIGKRPQRGSRHLEDSDAAVPGSLDSPPKDSPEKRIRAVFALADSKPLPRVNKRTLLAYHHHLAARLRFPFLARYWEEVSPLESVSHIVSVNGLVDLARQAPDASAGLRCLAQVEGRTIELPLAELELHNGTANARLIEDYWYWLWNWRARAGA